MPPAPKKMSLDQLADISLEQRPLFIQIKVEQPATGFSYTLDFIFQNPGGPYIRINTEKRAEFINKATEVQTEAALVAFAKQMRAITGGNFDIHPFYGLVWGTRDAKVAKGFGEGTMQLNESLTILIFLNDIDPLLFDDELTDTAANMGTEINSGTSAAETYLNYLKAPKRNHNQQHRDIAVVNGLGLAYELELAMHNGRQSIPMAMLLTPANIVNLVKQLEMQIGCTDPSVERVKLQK